MSDILNQLNTLLTSDYDGDVGTDIGNLANTGEFPLHLFYLKQQLEDGLEDYVSRIWKQYRPLAENVSSSFYMQSYELNGRNIDVVVTCRSGDCERITIPEVFIKMNYAQRIDYIAEQIALREQVKADMEEQHRLARIARLQAELNELNTPRR